MFTSRLPISTSVRRPTNPHNDGSTSFYGLNRASNIPVTVKKANLFTPQTKRPFLSGASTAGKSFTSGLNTDKKFPQRSLKPAPDREEQMKMFENLVTFMKTNAPNLAPPDPKKFFSSVSTTESSRIFEFLISRIIFDFKITRLEVDVPEALNSLEYPYIRSVTKSALVSVTTRQAVVGLLVIFNWLINSINQYNVESPETEDEMDEIAEIYINTLSMPPERLLEAEKKILDKMYQNKDVQTICREYDYVVEECEKIQQNTDEVEEIEHDTQILDEDIEKCRNYEMEMHKYIKVKRDEEDALMKQSALIKMQDDALRSQVAQLRFEIETNNIDVDEVMKQRTEMENLRTKLYSLLAQHLKELSNLNDKYPREVLLRLSEEYKRKKAEIDQQVYQLAQTIADLEEKQNHLKSALSEGEHRDLEQVDLQERAQEVKLLKKDHIEFNEYINSINQLEDITLKGLQEEAKMLIKQEESELDRTQKFYQCLENNHEVLKSANILLADKFTL